MKNPNRIKVLMEDGIVEVPVTELQVPTGYQEAKFETQDSVWDEGYGKSFVTSKETHYSMRWTTECLYILEWNGKRYAAREYEYSVLTGGFAKADDCVKYHNIPFINMFNGGIEEDRLVALLECLPSVEDAIGNSLINNEREARKQYGYWIGKQLRKEWKDAGKQVYAGMPSTNQSEEEKQSRKEWKAEFEAILNDTTEVPLNEEGTWKIIVKDGETWYRDYVSIEVPVAFNPVEVDMEVADMMLVEKNWHDTQKRNASAKKLADELEVSVEEILATFTDKELLK